MQTTILTVAEIDPLLERVRAAAGRTTQAIGRLISSEPDGVEVLRQMKFTEMACHPIDDRPLNLIAIEPMHVAAYIRSLSKDLEKPTVKQHLAAIRMLFNWLVVGQVVAINPAHSVRGPKHVVKRGNTPVLTPAEARQLLDSIDVTTLVGLRDRALIGLMAYSFARVGAAVAMRVEDYYPEGKRWRVRREEVSPVPLGARAHWRLILSALVAPTGPPSAERRSSLPLVPQFEILARPPEGRERVLQ